MKKLLSIILLSSLILCSGYKKPPKFVIDATTNASRHNTSGIQAFAEKDYGAAIQEFRIAIGLNPNTQSSAVYYDNLGQVYMTLGYPSMAKDCFERAIKLYGLNFAYYQNLAACYNKLNLTNAKIAQFRKSKNPYDKVLLGLLYLSEGKKQQGIMTLDDFCLSEPDLIITQGIRNYLSGITKIKQ